MRALVAVLLMVPSMVQASEWTTTDTVKEGAFLAVLAVDWLQTLQIAEECQPGYTEDRGDTTITYHGGKREESNPFLGECPSKRRVHTVIGLSAIGHVSISYVLPQPWRSYWQGITTGMEMHAVWKNHEAGLRISAHF